MIVVFSIIWAALAYGLVQDIITEGPTVGYGGVRLHHASSNVGTLLFLVIAAPIAAFWVFRVWNRNKDEMPLPRSAYTRRRRRPEKR